MKGNVIDMAVGIIIGGAFGTVVSSLVDDVIMPAISMAIGVQDYSQFLVFGAVKIGAFITAVVNFIIIAAALYFCIVLPMNKLMAMRKSEEPATEETLDESVVLLTEIRDALTRRA